MNPSSRLILCLLFCVLASLLNGCTPKKVVKESPKHDKWRHSIYPITAKDRHDFLLEETEKITEAEKSTPVFKEHLRRLAEYLSKSRNSEVEVPKIFNRDVAVYSLNRDAFASKFMDDRIRVARWRKSDDDKRRLDEVGVRHLAGQLTEPWKDAESFRIEFKISEIKTKAAYFDVSVLAEMTGRIDGKQGRSATGLWDIRWHKNKRSDGTLRIDSIRLLGHEEIHSYVENGLLLEDCAASVLRRDGELRASLGHGMDQWSKMLPGADILGDCGLSIGDVNRDGLDDIYVCQTHGLPNLLLIQNPDGTADDKAKEYGVDLMDHSYASLLIDLDDDGQQDLVVATDEALALYSNTNLGRFQLEHELRIGRGTRSLSAVDFDQDGDLDLFLTKHRPQEVFNDIFAQPLQRMESINGGRNVLLSNEEGWNFKDVTEDSGLAVGNRRYSTAGVWTDFDSDGDQDLFVTNEYHSDTYFENKDGWLAKLDTGPLAYEPGNHTTTSVGDLNSDGKPDILVGSNVSFETNRFIGEYLLFGGRYADEANGRSAPSRFWYSNDGAPKKLNFPKPIFSFNSAYGSSVADLNNDGMDDVLVTNGWLTRTGKGNLDAIFLQNHYQIPINSDEQDPPVGRRYKNEISELCRAGYSFSGFQRNRCLLQIAPGEFANYSSGSGFDFLEDGRAVATTDWDWDGDVDVIVTSRTAPRFRIMRNNLKSNNFHLTIQLRGTTSNRDAIGSRVEVYLAGRETPIVKTLQAGSGRAAQSSKNLHFGLGKISRIEKAVVYWPDGESQEMRGLQANKIYSIVEGREEPAEIANSRSKVALENQSILTNDSLPKRSSVLFYPPSRLPIIEFQGQREKWFSVSPLEGMTLLAVFCPFEDSEIDKVTAWTKHYRETVDADIDFVPLFFHADLSESSLFNRVEEKLSNSDFPFRWGTLANSSRDKLELLLGDWFFDQGLPKKPFAVLLDSAGQVCRAYHDDQLTWENVKNDNATIVETVKIAGLTPSPRNENWLARFRYLKLDRVAERFQDLGYAQDRIKFEKHLKTLKADAWFNRAWELASEGNLPEAAQFAETSLGYERQVPTLIGAAKIAQKQAGRAASQIKIQLLREAGKMLDEAISLDPGNPEAYIARADIFHALKDNEQAIAQLQQYLEINPEEWRVHANIGRLRFEIGETQKATEDLANAFENRPTLPFVAGELGTIYLHEGRYEDARKYLLLARKLQPSDPGIMRMSSEAEFWAGNLEECTALLQKAEASAPKSRKFKQYLAWVLATSPFESQRNGLEGLEMMEIIYENYSNESALVREIQAACLAEAGKFKEAEEVQLEALEMVEAETAVERYTDEQLKGLEERLELYRRSKPFRMSDTRRDYDTIPFPKPRLPRG